LIGFSSIMEWSLQIYRKQKTQSKVRP
jgi:hypothetical protein